MCVFFVGGHGCPSGEGGCAVQVFGYSLCDKKPPTEVLFGSCILLFPDCCGRCQSSSSYKSWAVTWHHKETSFAGKFVMWEKICSNENLDFHPKFKVVQVYSIMVTANTLLGKPCRSWWLTYAKNRQGKWHCSSPDLES